VKDAAVGKAVIVEMAVGTEPVTVETITSGVCVDGKAVTAAGPGRQAEQIGPAATMKSKNRF